MADNSKQTQSIIQQQQGMEQVYEGMIQSKCLIDVRQVKEKMIQNLAQEVVNKIVTEDVVNEKIDEEKDKQKEKGFCQLVCAPFTLEYYQPYFKDLTNQIVFQKIGNAFLPFKATFFEINNGQADFYGPFWIYATLIFALAASGNVSGYLQTQQGAKFKYNFQFIPTAATLVYGVAFLIPLILSIIMKMFGSQHLELAKVLFYHYISYKILCIYGYSCACIIPATILCAIPNPVIIKCFLFLIVTLMGMYHLCYGKFISIFVNQLLEVCNFFQQFDSELDKYIQQRKYIVIWFISGSQVVILLLYKLYFFNYIYSSNAQSSGYFFSRHELQNHKHLVTHDYPHHH